MNKRVLFGIIAATIVSLVIWLFWESKPKPGELIADQGRGHVPVGTEVKYNSNPPTSGPHYEEWMKPGIYNQVFDDRGVVHSLEHGYVIISYNCSFNSLPKDNSGLAQKNINDASVSAAASQSASLSPEFKTKSCQDLVNQLTDVYNNKGPHKLIVIPRPNLDTKIALSAWRYLDKFNDFDKKRIEKFIDGHRDQGPEKTLEP